jgi:hypothetical protein
MTDFALAEEFLAAYDVSDAVATVTDADRQTAYWNEQHMDEAIANKHIPVLIPPDKGSRGTPRRGWVGGRYTWMRRVLATELGRFIYRKRKQTIEPLFGHTKHNRGVNRFHRRGRTVVCTEWRLLMARMAVTDGHPQPHHAPPPPPRRRRALTRPHGGNPAHHHRHDGQVRTTVERSPSRPNPLSDSLDEMHKRLGGGRTDLEREPRLCRGWVRAPLLNGWQDDAYQRPGSASNARQTGPQTEHAGATARRRRSRRFAANHARKWAQLGATHRPRGPW